MQSLNTDRARCPTDRAVWTKIVVKMLTTLVDNPLTNPVSTRNPIPNIKLLFLNLQMKPTKRNTRSKPRKLWVWWMTTKFLWKNSVNVFKPITTRVLVLLRLLNSMNNLVTTSFLKRKENPSGRNSWRKSPMVSLSCFGSVLPSVSWFTSCNLLILLTYIWVLFLFSLSSWLVISLSNKLLNLRRWWSRLRISCRNNVQLSEMELPSRSMVSRLSLVISLWWRLVKRSLLMFVSWCPMKWR